MVYNEKLKEFLERNDVRELIENLTENNNLEKLYDLKKYNNFFSPDLTHLLLKISPNILEKCECNKIPDYMFCNCNWLKNITIPDNITNIGKCAFMYCKSLTNIIIPDSVKTIGDNAFWGCEGLTNIIIPDSVKDIGNYVFLGDEVTITTNNDYAINYCKKKGIKWKRI